MNRFSTSVRMIIPLLLLLVGTRAPWAFAQMQEPKAGQRQEVPVVDGLKLVFRYCPTSPDKKVPGFWISESEVSQEVFLKVLESAKKKNNAAEWQKRGARTERNVYEETFKEWGDEAEPMKFVGDAFPVFAVGINEAVAFCVSLGDAQGSDAASPISYRFRLPTRDEWRYACRSVADPAEAKQFPLFAKSANWPASDDKDVFGKPKYATWLKQQWEMTLKKPEPFKNTQAEVQELFADATVSKDPDARDFSSDLVAKVLGGKVDMIDGKGELVPTNDDKNKNNWEVRHLHGNAAEWTVESKADWGALKNGQKVKSVFIHGGHFRLSRKTNDAAWKLLTVEGNVELKYDDAIVPKTVGDERVGIRLVLEASLSPAWFANVRKEAIDGKNTGDADAWETKYRQEAEKLAAIDPDEVVPVQKRITFYAGLLHERAKDEKKALAIRETWLKELRDVAVNGPAAKGGEARAKTVGEDIDALRKVSPTAAATVDGRVALYRSFLYNQSSQDKEASTQLKGWLAAQQAAVRGKTPPSPAQLAEAKEDNDDLDKVKPKAADKDLKLVAGQARAWQNYRAGQTEEARKVLASLGTLADKEADRTTLGAWLALLND